MVFIDLRTGHGTDEPNFNGLKKAVGHAWSANDTIKVICDVGASIVVCDEFCGEATHEQGIEQCQDCLLELLDICHKIGIEHPERLNTKCHVCSSPSPALLTLLN